MPATPLTPQKLRAFPYARRAGASVHQRGRAYYRDGRVDEVELLDDRHAVCQVRGDSGDYEVSIRAEGRMGNLTFECDCPHADGVNFCKHMIAAGLELADVLEEEDDGRAYFDDNGDDDVDDYEDDDFLEPALTRPPSTRPTRPNTRKWQNQLGQLLGSAPRQRGSAAAGHLIGLVILERGDYASYGYGYAYGYGYGVSGSETYMLTPYVIRADAWPALPADESARTPAAINALLETNRSWARVGQPLTRSAPAAHYLNLDAQAAAFLNVLRSLRSPYYSYNQPAGGYLPLLLTMLAPLDLPLFKGNTRTHKIERHLRVLPEPVDLAIDLRQEKDGVTLLAGLEREAAYVPLETRVTVLARTPAWAMLGDTVAQLQDPEWLHWLEAFPLRIPARDVEAFRDQYLAGLAQRLPLRQGAVEWRDVRAAPVPRLYLRDDRQARLAAELRFGYGEHERPAQKTGAPVALVPVPDAWALTRLHRDPEREAACLQRLAGTDFGLKRAGAGRPYGTFVLRARVHPFDFLLHTVPALAQAGFEIYGEEALRIGKINRSPPTLRVALTSGIDWFDVKARVAFGDQEISLQAVRQALQRGERFIKLADGSAGQIPAEWLDKYKHLWGLATETKDGYRVTEAHLPLLDPLLEADPNIQVPRDLRQRRERLRSFDHLQSQPLPRHFNGELRPYQKHGLDWLCFLHDYQFGGILADDMGLGKTVQVLALLQLLKERAGRRGRAATLLVVPKSLVANWQREAERFTPGLRVLLHLGSGRSQDPARFDGYDVVLTTYGTLLRDVDRLRRYRFGHAILDESQAIKNPLAKSAKAARLLQADHRLVLTGTPVENNSLELWSQFAFLNPGLLGSLDYFRQEFATPIEARGDEAAAATLRRLVYPFILRRTKAQVAPELPPRVERVLYAELDGAQRKLYAQTRLRYQAELLNLIERKGLNDARFKVLEGLLRLRQIALHPRLVQPNYRGSAPKLEMLLETLETLQAEHHKVLVFSQFVAMLTLVRHELEARGLTYVYLDGRTTDRQARVDRFQTDPTYPFFLISLKAGGVGLNLTAADYVIHLDPWWNPAVEMQASDRAHRIGQAKPVFIYKLIARDTVEEKILALQEKKRALVASLVSTEASFFKALTADDVRQLFA